MFEGHVLPYMRGLAWLQILPCQIRTTVPLFMRSYLKNFLSVTSQIDLLLLWRLCDLTNSQFNKKKFFVTAWNLLTSLSPGVVFRWKVRLPCEYVQEFFLDKFYVLVFTPKMTIFPSKEKQYMSITEQLYLTKEKLTAIHTPEHFSSLKAGSF